MQADPVLHSRRGALKAAAGLAAAATLPPTVLAATLPQHDVLFRYAAFLTEELELIRADPRWAPALADEELVPIDRAVWQFYAGDTAGPAGRAERMLSLAGVDLSPRTPGSIFLARRSA